GCDDNVPLPSASRAMNTGTLRVRPNTVWPPHEVTVKARMLPRITTTTIVMNATDLRTCNVWSIVKTLRLRKTGFSPGGFSSFLHVSHAGHIKTIAHPRESGF